MVPKKMPIHWMRPTTQYLQRQKQAFPLIFFLTQSKPWDNLWKCTAQYLYKTPDMSLVKQRIRQLLKDRRPQLKTAEYSAACCRSTHVLVGECNQMSVGTVLPQLALQEPSPSLFTWSLVSVQVKTLSPLPLDFRFLLSQLAGMNVNGSAANFFVLFQPRGFSCLASQYSVCCPGKRQLSLSPDLWQSF